MVSKKVLPGLLLVLATGWAQGTPGGGFRLLGVQPGRPGKVVANAPYSADVSTVFTRTLPDGNHIQRVTSEHLYRDSEGRTRRETMLDALSAASGGSTAPQLAFIDDPVNRVSYVHNMTNRTATKTAWPPEVQPAPFGGNAGSVARAPQKAQAAANTVKQSLGTQMVAGVMAEGTRTTRTIPTGQIGNAQPIQIVTERWYSPELQIVVAEKRIDPRSGETDYTVSNLSRAEPPSTLFSIPADVQVTENKPRLRKRSPQR